MFRGDCRVDDLDTESFDWNKSETMTALDDDPRAIIQPCYELAGQNLIHAAALKGKNDFLSNVLLVKNDGSRDTRDGKLGWASRQKLAFFAIMAMDRHGQTPLAIALHRRSTHVIKEIFTCLQLLFSQPYSSPYSKTNKAQEIHLQEHYSINEICEALEKIPDLTLDFLSKLSLVTSGHAEIHEGVSKFEFNKMSNGRFILGSKKRCPHGFWTTALEEIGERQQVAKRRAEEAHSWITK